MKQHLDLKAFRQANNLVQAEIERVVEGKQAFISRIENGKAPMPASMLKKLREYYKHTNIEEYIKEDGMQRPTKVVPSFDLKAYRKKYNLTQKDIANALQCTQSSISLIEQGEISFSMSNLRKLSVAYPDTDVNKYLSSETVTSGKTESEIPKEQSVSILDRMMQLSEQMLTIQVQMSQLQTENYHLKQEINNLKEENYKQEQENKFLKVANQRLTDYNERLKRGDCFEKEGMEKATA
jgi:transcriptional regulator with XRE-family HTH domain